MATISAHVSAPERRRIYLAAALALVLETGVLAGAYLLLTHRHGVQAELPATVLTLAPAVTPAPIPAALPPAPQAAPRPVTHLPQPVHRAEHAVTQRPAVHIPAPAVPPKPDPAPAVPSTAPTEPPAVSHPAPPPVAAPATPAIPATPGASFEAALRAAIQSALHYPESARMGGIAGRTRVAFEYHDGVISGARVVISSGVGLLDRAALAAVRDAVSPKPESAFAGKTLSEQLWVTFNLNETE
ncbi:TonB family protein [Paraburkholderia sediminicola]|uniref:TonB family protein n=1 Tax=Paraburkholderia sediminicola TaxID=458836 RepID=UPI0038BC4221